MGTVWGVLNVSIGGYHVNCFQLETNHKTNKDGLLQDDGLFKEILAGSQHIVNGENKTKVSY